MKKPIIAGIFDTEEGFSPAAAGDTKRTLFPLVTGNKRLNFGIAEALKDLEQLKIHPSDKGLDLMVLAAHVYAADTRILRKSQSQDSWTREIRIIVPVSNPALWNKSSHLFSRLLNFLTGDLWEVEFRPRPRGFEMLLPQKPNSLFPSPFDKVQLFSGGLDSLIGTIDNLENGFSPLLVSHAGDGATSQAQEKCFQKLKGHFSTKNLQRLRLWMNIPVNTFEDETVEDTTRGRSFLFFTIGILAGTGLNKSFVLETPENGLIALNVPLDVLRLGSLSTHTTHPFYMGLWNEILKVLEIDGKIINPYWNRTKGEMMDECKNAILLQSIISDSLSCSSPTKARWKGGKGKSIEHCGYCLPCIIRRASIHHAASFHDNTRYTLANLKAQPLDSDHAEGLQIRSFQLAIRRIIKNRSTSKLFIHKSGPLGTDPATLSELADVYQRGLSEVNELLKGVTTRPRDKS